ncbi:MAG: GTPase [Caldisphaera sp.]|nr:GTPase [Caldisphaera sp.]PMP60276.1 MAG: GTP-binding protein [Caldisphaera sp.]PMP88681.1 MAG: GTP-binding protein [Caldisphaera sp.]
MVTNLPAEAIAKLNKYSDAKTHDEKIKALEEFISAVPKHKGTENLLYWARSRLAELRQEEEKERRKKRGGGGPKLFIEKTGAGQIAVIGPPNSGKSSIVSRLTNAKVLISPVPFSTNEPVPGMMSFEDIKFQLIDTPPIIGNEGNYVNTKTMALARNADALIIVIGLDYDPINSFKRVSNTLEKKGIIISIQKGFIRIIKERVGNGINVLFYGRPSFTEEDVKRALSSYRIYDATVEIYGKPSLDDIDSSLLNAKVYKPTIVLFNKSDLVKNREEVEDGIEREKIIPNDVKYYFVSAKNNENLEKLGKEIFNMLKIKRIYTKKPNSPPDKDPLIIRENANVKEIAEAINPHIANIKYAKIWGSGVKYDGQRVGPEYVPKDKDVVEIRY